jgi:long-chain acyl-CoA synthetase
MPRENLLSLFRDFATHRDDIAIIQKHGYRRETWTYAKLLETAKGCALFLRQNGVKTGDRVLLWAPNSAEWVAVFWGCLLRGAVVVPMDEGASADFVERVAREAAVKLAFTFGRGALAGADALQKGLQVVGMEEIADSLQGANLPNARNAAGEPSAANYDSFSDVPVTRASLAEILFTSGTTSEPRGVLLTHGNFLANLQPLEAGIAAYRKYERWFHPLRFVTLVPLSHVFGQFMALFVPPLLGAGVVFESSATAPEIMRTIKRERATALVAVPRMVEMLRSGIERNLAASGRSEWLAGALQAAAGKKFLRRAWMFRRIHQQLGWKFWAFISGGAALATRDEEFFRRIGYAVVQGYGMTETASLISLNHPFRAAAGSIGKVLPGREFKLGEDGEILVRGENVSAGYWEAGQQRVSEGSEWLHTGDIGELDGEGNLHFRGRKKNVMVTPAGLNIYPEDLEAVLRKQAGVRDCVVVPIERDENAQPCAVMLLDIGETGKGVDELRNLARTVIDRANSSLAEYQRIHDSVVWPELDFPRTSTGKPRLAVITDRVRELLGLESAHREIGAHGGDGTGQSNEAGERASSNESLDQLVRCFASHSGPTPNLERDLSLTSLDRVELMSALEEKYHVELDETSFSNAKNVADIQTLLNQPAAQRAEFSYPSWAQSWPIRAIRLAVYYAVVWPATSLLAHPRVIGGENLLTLRGPTLVVSNHVTRRADIGLILAALPARYRNTLATAMSGETLQNMRQPPRARFVGKRWAYQLGYWLVTALFNVFPLPQRSGFRESFRFAGESVDRGHSILVFPEGEVTRDGSVGPFQGGIGLLSNNLRLPVVPMRLDGVWQMKLEHRRIARLGEIIVRIGAPIRFPAGTDPQSIARTLEDAVRSL